MKRTVNLTTMSVTIVFFIVCVLSLGSRNAESGECNANS